MFGKQHRVADRPVRLAEWREQRLAFEIQVAFEPAPAVVAAQRLALFEQHDVERGVFPPQGERNEPASKAAAQDCNIGAWSRLGPCHALLVSGVSPRCKQM